MEKHGIFNLHLFSLKIFCHLKISGEINYKTQDVLYTEHNYVDQVLLYETHMISKRKQSVNKKRGVIGA